METFVSNARNIITSYWYIYQRSVDYILSNRRHFMLLLEFRGRYVIPIPTWGYLVVVVFFFLRNSVCETRFLDELFLKPISSDWKAIKNEFYSP